ncbi:MAG TPA: hypothetical protein VFI96_08830 [Longimicrobiaceae bacterium]|nr:hypothetical protein [Longimicrobiaceae bacterium]
MEHTAIRERQIRMIPKHEPGELAGGERVGMVVVALIGLTGVVGTLVLAWSLALG